MRLCLASTIFFAKFKTFSIMVSSFDCSSIRESVGPLDSVVIHFSFKSIIPTTVLHSETSASKDYIRPTLLETTNAAVNEKFAQDAALELSHDHLHYINPSHHQHYHSD